jgi:hypothetical protein
VLLLLVRLLLPAVAAATCHPVLLLRLLGLVHV